MDLLTSQIKLCVFFKHELLLNRLLNHTSPYYTIFNKFRKFIGKKTLYYYRTTNIFFIIKNIEYLFCLKFEVPYFLVDLLYHKNTVHYNIMHIGKN